MSTDIAKDLWARAIDALKVARLVEVSSPDSSASRSYYAAFYAVSCHFALQGKSFRKHTAVEAAVHRELIRPGIWDRQLGADYSALQELRGLGDYGVMEHVTPEDAHVAIELAQSILRATAQLHPDALTPPAGDCPPR